MAVFLCRAARAASPSDVCEPVSARESLRVTSLTGAVSSCDGRNVPTVFAAEFVEAVPGAAGGSGLLKLTSSTDTRDESTTLLPSNGFSLLDCSHSGPVPPL